MDFERMGDKELRALFATLHEEYLQSTYKGITGGLAEARYTRLRDELMEVVSEIEMRRKSKRGSRS
jgi:hypothetical protein